ncbi:MAG: long-chain-fatty-acid--CoA ligase [Rhodococcus sp. (in: high G+C Gram-positive bacteria)]
MDTVADLLLARRDDHDTALLFENRRVTWAEHVDISRRWASSIDRMLDETSPRHVGVLLDNIPEFSYLLGAAALGGFVLVGLNSTRSAAALVEDARRTHCRFVLTDTARIGTLSTPSFDATSADWRARMSAGPAMTPVVDELMMLVFTSGTSGDPKAVRCTHSKVAAPGRMLAERFDLGPQDTVYVSMPLFHSNAVMAGWSVALASGANLALRRTFSASGFFSDVRAFGATYANYVGTPLSYVLQTPQRPDDRDNPLRVAYGNEATPGAAAHFAERFGVRVVDGFGSSEGGVSIARTPDTPPGALGPLPDGVEIHAVDGSRCASALFDQHGALLNESDAVGELVNTSGPGMFCGYYDDPEAEADRMRHGMYYSGDLAYADVDGYAYFAGRSSGWLRVGGENLGSAPIERILLRHSGVEAVSVYGVPAAGPGDRVMAAIVAPSNVMDGFAGFLAAQSDLSARAHPHLVRVCTELPRTASHKILARRLQQQRWNTDDPIWLAEGAGSEFRLLSEAERRELDKSIGSRPAR